MARLRDAGSVIRKVGPWKFIWRIYQRMNEDNLLVWASALAYSWLFSLFPFLIFVLTLMPYMPAPLKEGTEKRVHYAVMQLPPKASEAVWTGIEPIMHRLLHQPPRGLLSTGLIVMIWAASSGMSMTMQAMDKCWKTDSCRPYYKQRGLAILLTIIEASLMLGILLLLPIGTIVTHWIIAHIQQVADFLSAHLAGRFASTSHFISTHVEALLVVWDVLRYLVALILMFLATALVYYFGPSGPRRFLWTTPGAIFAIAVWLILGWLFRIYVTHFGKGYQAYGTVGGVAILLLFFYIDAVVLLLGVEIDSEIETRAEKEKVKVNSQLGQTTAS